MSAANVQFLDRDKRKAAPGAEVSFSFACPKFPHQCGRLLVAGRSPGIDRNGQNREGGVAMWDWDGNREAPTFSPSIDCKGCWHGFIEAGRCVDMAKRDEPTIYA